MLYLIKTRTWSGLLLLFCLFLLSPLAAAEKNQARSLRIDSAELASILSREDLLVLDVRKPEDYAAGHIPGAVNLPVNKTFRQSGRTDRVAGPAYIQELFGNAGIDRQKQLVVYDDGAFIDAGRMFWVLEVYGHQRVRLLDGGFPAWRHLGMDVSTQVHVPQPSVFLALGQPEKLVTKLSMRLAIKDQEVNIIDARSAAEFAGEKSISSRFGHIPQAVNIPWDEGFVSGQEFSRLKTIDELLPVFAGLDKGKKVITYCNKGKQSSFSYFLLRELGYDAAHYDGSWFEWSMDSNLPITVP